MATFEYGTVVGTFVWSMLTGNPGDAQPVVGATISFVSRAGVIRDVPFPRTILSQRIVGTTDSEGVLRDADGNVGVRLLATDDPNLNPTGFTWLVTVAADEHYSYSFDLVMPADAVIDLATVTPVPAAEGVAYVRGIPGIQGPVGPSGLQNYMGNLLPIYAAVGGWQNTAPPSVALSYRAFPANTAVATPFIPASDLTIDRIGTAVDSWTGGRAVRIALFDSNELGNLPGALIADFGLTALNAEYTEIVIDQALVAGHQYWLAIELTPPTTGTVSSKGVIFTSEARRFAQSRTEAFAGPGNASLAATWPRTRGPFEANWGGTTYGSEIIPVFAIRRSA